ncbi:hypothetical protein F511_14490 [Dorcoceras hygrometricum]|uniref:Uncharacterized protein n=1 Tax=Dorcoceras hygrometricum TaxID=472368 RepID=A0A2Z7AXU8_9LAMI|nr:hypothetical protein F511_14490 [Dorcoceras hygrometricum]
MISLLIQNSPARATVTLTSVDFTKIDTSHFVKLALRLRNQQEPYNIRINLQPHGHFAAECNRPKKYDRYKRYDKRTDDRYKKEDRYNKDDKSDERAVDRSKERSKDRWMRTRGGKRTSRNHDRKVLVADESTKSWADTDSESSSSSSPSSDSEQEEVHCLMADQTSNDEVFDFSNVEFTREDLVSALNDMVKEYRKISHSFEEVKAENSDLKNSSAKPSAVELGEADSLKIELSKLTAEDELLREESSELKAEIESLNELVSSSNQSSRSLQKMQESQKPANDRTGLGFNCSDSSEGETSPQSQLAHDKFNKMSFVKANVVYDPSEADVNAGQNSCSKRRKRRRLDMATGCPAAIDLYTTVACCWYLASAATRYDDVSGATSFELVAMLRFDVATACAYTHLHFVPALAAIVALLLLFYVTRMRGRAETQVLQLVVALTQLAEPQEVVECLSSSTRPDMNHEVKAGIGFQKPENSKPSWLKNKLDKDKEKAGRKSFVPNQSWRSSKKVKSGWKNVQRKKRSKLSEYEIKAQQISQYLCTDRYGLSYWERCQSNSSMGPERGNPIWTQVKLGTKIWFYDHRTTGKWVCLVTLAMSLFDLQDVCIAIGSLANLDLPMVVDLIGIYVLEEYCDVLSMQMDSDLVIYRTTLVRTFQVNRLEPGGGSEGRAAAVVAGTGRTNAKTSRWSRRRSMAGASTCSDHISLVRSRFEARSVMLEPPVPGAGPVRRALAVVAGAGTTKLKPHERASVSMLAGITRILERQSEHSVKSHEEDFAERCCRQGPKEFAGTTYPLVAEEWNLSRTVGPLGLVLRTLTDRISEPRTVLGI